MSISNGYIALSDLKAWLSITTDTDDPLMELAVESASRAVDHFCNRRFWLDAVASARTYRTPSPVVLYTDDIGATGYIVATDTDEDGIFETVLAANTFQAQPSNALVQGNPITSLRVVNTGVIPTVNNLFPVYPDARYSIQVTAQWGFPSVPAEVKQATTILAARIKTRKDTPYGILSFGDVAGGMRITPWDYDVQALLNPLRRMAA